MREYRRVLISQDESRVIDLDRLVSIGITKGVNNKGYENYQIQAIVETNSGNIETIVAIYDDLETAKSCISYVTSMIISPEQKINLSKN